MVFTLGESSRAITLLSSGSKIKRKESLTAIEQDVSENLPKANINEIKDYCSWIIPHLVLLIADPVESHRERSLCILSTLCEHVDESACFIPSVTQILVKRLTTEESQEESEEIRLTSLKLLNAILQKLQNGASCIDDYCLILRKSLEDTFHEVKVVCCSILQVLAIKFSSLFYQVAEPLLNPLLRNIVHQQHKVRFATVEAVGPVFEHCNGKFVDLAIAPLTQRLFDPSISVRKAVIQVTGGWLLNLPDRYSYHTKLIPLILSGWIDECNEIRDEAGALWDDIGLKFQKENENDLKDKIDFDPGKPSHYPLDQVRPNFGCRELISRSASRLLPGLCNDLRDWQEATRHKAAGLLPIILLHLESGVTQHTQTLVTGLCNGVAEILFRVSANSSLHLILMSPQRGLPCLTSLFYLKKAQGTGSGVALSGELVEAFSVLQHLFAAARYVSCFVEPQIWWKLLSENSRRCLEATAPASLAANYFLLANLLAGSSVDALLTCSDSTTGAQLNNTCPILRISTYLTSEEQISCAAFTSKAGLLECANALIALLKGIVEKSDKKDMPGGDSSEDVLKKIVDKLLEDTFFLLMAISSGWEERIERTEFVTELNDQVGRLLCQLSRLQYTWINGIVPEMKDCPESRETSTVEELVTKSKRAGQILEWLYGYQLPKLLKRLDATRKQNGRGWHAKSVGLAIFCHAVLAAGPGLLLGLEPTTCKCNNETNISQVNLNESPLFLTLRLLEEGCRLGEPLNTNSEGSSGPLLVAAEAELHLRGLLMLMRLTEHARVRLILTQPRLFRYCMDRLVLPSCLWRAGRTAEAMRKAAATSLVALLAAVVPLSSPAAKSLEEGITPRERILDQWLDERIEPTKGKLAELRNKNALLSSRVRLINPPTAASGNVEDTGHLANLGLVSSASPRLLGRLLARLGAILTDDVEATRLLACTGLTLLFGGIFSGGSEDAVGGEFSVSGDRKYVPKAFLRSPAWFLPLLSDDAKGIEEVDIEGYGDKMPGLTTPLPNSLGDKVYRFYPSLLKALDDSSDDVRLRAADALVTWFWVMSPNLIVRPPPVLQHTPESSNDSPSQIILNPVFSAVLDDLIASVAVHLDDGDGTVRAAAARIMLRIAQVASDSVRRVLSGARERHRSPQLCEALLTSLEWRCEES